jgi:hypothetical protein
MIEFEIQIGLLFVTNPYIIHRKTPIVNEINIPIDTSLADLVLIVFKTCGTKAIVVNVAAQYPNKSK